MAATECLPVLPYCVVRFTFSGLLGPLDLKCFSWSRLPPNMHRQSKRVSCFQVLNGVFPRDSSFSDYSNSRINHNQWENLSFKGTEYSWYILRDFYTNFLLLQRKTHCIRAAKYISIYLPSLQVQSSPESPGFYERQPPGKRNSIWGIKTTYRVGFPVKWILHYLSFIFFFF